MFVTVHLRERFKRAFPKGRQGFALLHKLTPRIFKSNVFKKGGEGWQGGWEQVDCEEPLVCASCIFSGDSLAWWWWGHTRWKWNPRKSTFVIQHVKESIPSLLLFSLLTSSHQSSGRSPAVITADVHHTLFDSAEMEPSHLCRFARIRPHCHGNRSLLIMLTMVQIYLGVPGSSSSEPSCT